MKTEQQIKKLIELKAAKYKLMGDPDPKAAAIFAVEGVLNMYRNEKEHLAQLLDEEIDDAIKAGLQAARMAA